MLGEVGVVVIKAKAKVTETGLFGEVVRNIIDIGNTVRNDDLTRREIVWVEGFYMDAP